jgi:hypothetical protein
MHAIVSIGRGATVLCSNIRAAFVFRIGRECRCGCRSTKSIPNRLNDHRRTLGRSRYTILPRLHAPLTRMLPRGTELLRLIDTATPQSLFRTTFSLGPVAPKFENWCAPLGAGEFHECIPRVWPDHLRRVSELALCSGKRSGPASGRGCFEEHRCCLWPSGPL